jgi:hypothetical protein
MITYLSIGVICTIYWAFFDFLDELSFTVDENLEELGSTPLPFNLIIFGTAIFLILLWPLGLYGYMDYLNQDKDIY